MTHVPHGKIIKELKNENVALANKSVYFGMFCFSSFFFIKVSLYTTTEATLTHCNYFIVEHVWHCYWLKEVNRQKMLFYVLPVIMTTKKKKKNNWVSHLMR